MTAAGAQGLAVVTPLSPDRAALRFASSFDAVPGRINATEAAVPVRRR